MDNINPDLFEDYDRLLTITIEDRQVQVPENNSILRAFQFIGADMFGGKFCWNGECENCLFAYTEGEGEEVKRALACQQLACENMKIIQLPKGVRLVK